MKLKEEFRPLTARVGVFRLINTVNILCHDLLPTNVFNDPLYEDIHQTVLFKHES